MHKTGIFAPKRRKGVSVAFELIDWDEIIASLPDGTLDRIKLDPDEDENG